MIARCEKQKLGLAALQAVAGGFHFGGGRGFFTYAFGSNGGGHGSGKGSFSFESGNSGTASAIGLVNIGSGKRS